MKAFWIATTVVQRLYGFVPAAVALAAWRGADRASGVLAITVGVAIGWSLAHLSVSGWYTWVTSYVPEDTRATFFGRRSAVLNTVSVVGITAVTVLIDQFEGRTLYLAYFWIFLVAGVAGVADIALAVAHPRAAPTGPPARAGAGRVRPPSRGGTSPSRSNRNFLVFTLSIALFGFSTSVLSPFIAPYITAPGRHRRAERLARHHERHHPARHRGDGHRLGHAGRPVRPQAGRAPRRPAPAHLDRLLLPHPEQLRVHPARRRPRPRAARPGHQQRGRAADADARHRRATAPPTWRGTSRSRAACRPPGALLGGLLQRPAAGHRTSRSARSRWAASR